QSGRTVQSSVPMRKYEQQEPPPLLVLEPIQSVLGLRPMNLVETPQLETRPPNALCIVARSFSLRERTKNPASLSRQLTVRRIADSSSRKAVNFASPLTIKR